MRAAPSARRIPSETHRPAANPRTGEWESLQNFVCFEKPKGPSRTRCT